MGKDVKHGQRTLPLDMSNPIVEAAMSYAIAVGERESWKTRAIERKARDKEAARLAWVAYYDCCDKAEDKLKELDAIVRREGAKHARENK